MTEQADRHMIRTSDGVERCFQCGKEGGHPKLACEKCGGLHLTKMHDIPRRHGGKPVSILFGPSELGYLCPQKHRASNIDWSEFEDHVWCCVCEKDYPSSECFLQRPTYVPEKEFKEFIDGLPFKAKVLDGVLDIPDGEWH